MNVDGTLFGSELRQYRTSKGISQLALASEAQTTPRHVSFLETGRSRPTAPMVERLCDALGVQLKDRNQLFVSAGFPPRYPEEDFGAARYDTARSAIRRLLTAHDPYPAIVMTRKSDVLEANLGAARLFGCDLTGSNMMAWLYSHGDPSNVIANWPEVARATFTQLRTEAAQYPLDENLKAAVVAWREATQDMPEPDDSGTDLVVSPWFIVGGQTIRTMVLAARFDNAVDVTLDDLRVELMYPADNEAEEFFRGVDAN